MGKNKYRGQYNKIDTSNRQKKKTTSTTLLDIQTVKLYGNEYTNEGKWKQKHRQHTHLHSENSIK